MLEYIVRFIVSPINATLLLLICGFLLLRLTRLTKWIGNAMLVIGLTWFLACSQFIFSYWLMAPLENKFPPVKTESKKWKNVSAIWVLACYHFDAVHLPKVSQFNDCSLQRLVQAANMYRASNMPILLTGGMFNPKSQLNYASQAALFLIQMGVNEQDIIVINSGTNTLEEAMAVFDIIKKKKVAVISSASHGVRLAIILNSQNYIFVPVHFSVRDHNYYVLNWPSVDSIKRSERALYEYAAIIKTLMFEK